MTVRGLKARIWVVLLLGAIAMSDGTTSAYGAECKAEKQTWAATAEARRTGKHLGLPKLEAPSQDPAARAKIELGRKLFFDRRLSINQTISCGMCHVPEQAFANNELKTAVGVEGRGVKRNTPTVINIGFLEVLFHDGRDVALETQFIAPLVARNEMANPSAGYVVARLNAMEDYKPLFAAAFGAPASLDRIGQALARYQQSLVSGNSPFDRFYFGGDAAALNAGEKRGLEIFTGKGGCVSCHQIDEDAALFTDHQFHDTGYGWLREQARQNPDDIVMVEVAPGVTYPMRREAIEAVGAPAEPDLGRYEVTEDPDDRWKFRTAPLRNVALTAPYMHDGHLATLHDVIAFYDRGGPGHALQDARVRPLGLSTQEKADLEAFLRSLTSPDLACLVREARIAPPDNS